MCDVLQIARSTFYYKAKEQTKDDELTQAIVNIFRKNRKAYGTRKIKVRACEKKSVSNTKRVFYDKIKIIGGLIYYG